MLLSECLQQSAALSLSGDGALHASGSSGRGHYMRDAVALDDGSDLEGGWQGGAKGGKGYHGGKKGGHGKPFKSTRKGGNTRR